MLTLALPFGPCTIAASKVGLTRVAFAAPEDLSGRPETPVTGDSRSVQAILEAAQEQLQAYFAGQLKQFELPLDVSARTRFQRDVLAACVGVGYGEQVSYGELARRSGHPGAARAVGQVMATNPLVLVVPCHRIIGSGGGLTGFGAGLALKQALLAMEQRSGAWEAEGVQAESRRT
jgi:methylated-DNA-[protein]-cysteine S-methyltransferase